MRTLLDLKGLVYHSLHQGEDGERNTTGKGAKLNSVAHCVHNFVNNYLLPSLECSRLNEIIVVLDSGNAYRKAQYPAYKANRDLPPEKIDQQAVDRVEEALREVKSILSSLGVPAVSCDGVEADDILAYLTQHLPDVGIIYTVDRDILQLASEDTSIFLMGTVTDRYALYSGSPKKYLMPVEPRHVALLKSLVGDSGDNYPGIPGFGPAKFAELEKNYGLDGLDDLVNVVENQDFNGMLMQAIEQTGDKLLKMLYDHRESWRLCWVLAKLHPELVEQKLAGKFNRLKWYKHMPNPELLEAHLSEMGNRHLLEKLKPFMPVKTLVTADSAGKFTIPWLSREFKKSPFVSLDWETTDQLKHQPFREASRGREFVDMLSSSITGAGMTFGEHLEHTLYFAFDHADTNNLPRQHLIDVLSEIPDEVPMVIQNVLFERNVLKNSLGASLTGFHDTKVMSHYVDENLPNGLKESSWHWFHYRQTRYEDVIAKGKTMSDYSARHVFEYGADDPLVTAHLYDLYKTIMQIEGTWDFFVENEMPPIEILSDSYLAGVEIDWEELERQTVEDRGMIEKSMSNLRKLLRENQTEETIQSGLARLYDINKELVELQAKEDGKSVEEALQGLFAKLHERIRYADYEIVDVFPKLDLTPSAFAPVLQKLGLPVLDDLKSPNKVSAYVAAYYQSLEEAGDTVSQEIADFLTRLATAVCYNKTDKSAMQTGRGRDNVHYTSFIDSCRKYLTAKRAGTGSELNIGSPAQMQVLLYGMLDLPIRMYAFELTDTQKRLGITTPSVQANEDAIVTAMAEDCYEFPWKREALECLLTARKCQTRMGLFYDTYPKWKHPIDGLIHPQINSCGTDTRRPTGSSPNPLQWPKRGDGKKFRKCIIPNKKLGHDLIVSIDFSQQELRVAGALSRDPAMLDCYIGKDVEHVLSDNVKAMLGESLLNRFLQTDTKDIHTQTATGLMKAAYEDVVIFLENELEARHKEAKDARQSSKTINFLSQYGGGATKLARELICPVDEAKKFLEAKRELYSVYEEWGTNNVMQVSALGYVTSIYGNRRHMHQGILQKDEGLRRHAERQANNYAVQGGCADHLKVVLTDIYKQGILGRTGAVLIAPIYDEVVFSVNHGYVVDLIMSVHEIMTQDMPGLPVPILAEPSLGVNFADQIEIGRFPTQGLIEAAMAKAFRKLILHDESDHLFEIFEPVTEGKWDITCSDVTSIPQFEERFLRSKAA